MLPALSVARTVNEEVVSEPTALAVPDNAAVLVLNDNPVGIAPETIE